MYVVTGGAGFIGSAFVAKLNQLGIEDILIVDEFESSSKWKNVRNKFYTDYVHKDRFLQDLEAGQYRNISGVVHMGASSSTTEMNMDYLMDNNVHYTARLAEYCINNGIRFVYASSAATYGDGEKGYSDEDDIKGFLPLNPYGYSKQLFDLMALQKSYLDKIVGLKFFNVYGPNEYHKAGQASVVWHAYNQIISQGVVKLFKSYRPEYADGEQKRDFIYVKDCAEAMWWFLENPETNGLFNLGTGKARTWNDLVHAAFAALSLEPKIEYIDMPENLVNQYQYFTEASMKKFEAIDTGINFHSLEDGVKDYIQGYLAGTSIYL
ncbi:MAG: ADP-glyceromanno-heptose 6-epimerase [Bdellovibrionales bacterium]|nr:ADP-glyceromanno-heptose 6-epimerase [Bdellovibrionales bacterium]